MKRSLVVLSMLIVLCASIAVHAQSVDAQLRSAVRQRFGARMHYYTVVPYKNTYFASCYDVSSSVRNSTGKETHWGIWEYKNGRWSFIFSLTSTVDADEESARLDALFARYQFSSTMRHNLMDGTEHRL